MKFSWLSNAPWSPTGYGNQTALFLPRFKAAGHEVACIAFYGLEGTPIGWNGIDIYPKGLGPYGLDVADAHTNHYGARVCLSLIDGWVMEPGAFVSGVKWIPWFPVDHDPIQPIVADKVRRAYRRIVYSEFGKRKVEEAGMDCYYVPHGVDTNLFLPLPQDKVREVLGWPNDRFIIGMVAANKGRPSRKAFFETIMAFAQFKRKHPDAALYLHTTRGDNGEYEGVNLPEFITAQGLTHTTLGRPDQDTGADIWFCDQYIAILGFPDRYMQHVYNAIDLHSLVTMGEGFGIPTLEAQACGTPVVVSGWTASEELCFAGEVVPLKSATPYWTPLGSWQFIPSVGSIAAAFERAYQRPASREKARKGALQYDADLVMDKYWAPVLAEIAEDVAAWEGEVR